MRNEPKPWRDFPKDQEFIKALKTKVRKDFGKPCKGFNWFCACCAANTAAQILEDLYD